MTPGRIKKIVIRIFVLLIILNLPPFTGLLTAIFVDMKGASFGFITKDLHFFKAGGIERIENSESLVAYKKRYPNADHVLYRFAPEKNYFWFWRYGEYIFNPNWKIPYIHLPPDFSPNPYYGNGMNDAPLYKWDEIGKQWVKIAPAK